MLRLELERLEILLLPPASIIDVLKIQQENEREELLKIQQENEREELLKIQQENERRTSSKSSKRTREERAFVREVERGRRGVGVALVVEYEYEDM